MKTNTKTQNETSAIVTSVASSTTHDLKNAILIVSVIANLYILTAWIALQVTTRYDEQLASFLFNR